LLHIILLVDLGKQKKLSLTRDTWNLTEQKLGCWIQPSGEEFQKTIFQTFRHLFQELESVRMNPTPRKSQQTIFNTFSKWFCGHFWPATLKSASLQDATGS